jgi:enediyne biosynthesis protein E4
MSRRTVGLLTGVVGVAIIGVGLVWIAVSRGGGTTPSVALGPPRYVDETTAAGIDHTYGGSSTFSVGGGVAVFDCNGDGRPEIYLAGGGSSPAALYRNDSPVGGALRFSALHDPATDLSDVNGAYPLDIDGDGNVDLAVLRNGGSVLLRGLGDCRFERANEALRFDGGNGQTTAFSATWEGSGLPTLAVGNYLKLDARGESGLDCDTSELVRPAASGTSYGSPLSLAPGYCTLSMLFSDWDRSGRRDLRVSNDRHYYDPGSGQEQLWRIAPSEAPRLYVDGWVQVQIEGMGIASYDITGDGYPDVYLTSQGPNKLQTLTAGPSQPTFRDIASKRGVSASAPFTGGDTRPSTAWHPEFQDANNDGFIDLYVTKGNVEEIPTYAAVDPSDLLLGQPDGTFQEAAKAAGVLDFARGRGAALADFNLDGMLDLVKVNLGAPVRLWRNVGAGDAAHPLPMGHWLAVMLRQPGSNRNAIGSWIEVRLGDTTMRRELTVGGGHSGGQLGPIHFGLGPSDEAQIRVQWPDGQQGPWVSVKADQSTTIER